MLRKLLIAQETAHGEDNVAHRIAYSSEICQVAFVPKVKVENKVRNHSQTKGLVRFSSKFRRENENTA